MEPELHSQFKRDLYKRNSKTFVIVLTYGVAVAFTFPLVYFLLNVQFGFLYGLLIFLALEFVTGGVQRLLVIDPKLFAAHVEAVKRLAKKHQINPQTIELHLRHNDYPGLEYTPHPEGGWTARIKP